jgi:hypothetical protein
MRGIELALTPFLAHSSAFPQIVILVLGTRIHEFASDMRTCESKLVDGRAKHDHDGEGRVGEVGRSALLHEPRRIEAIDPAELREM